METLLKTAIANAKMQQPFGSPCIDVCRLNPQTGYCEGCFRTLEEIRSWKTMTDSDKRDYSKRCSQGQRPAIAASRVRVCDARNDCTGAARQSHADDSRHGFQRGQEHNRCRLVPFGEASGTARLAL